MSSEIQELMFSEPGLQDILKNRVFQSMAGFRHHGEISCLAHTLQVGEIVYSTARRWNLDYISATRGALLHDFYLYDWHIDSPGLHGLKHARIALENAGQFFDLNEIEQNAILRHMWPLTPIPPRYPESLLVSLADKVSSYREYRRIVRTLFLQLGRRAVLGGFI